MRGSRKFSRGDADGGEGSHDNVFFKSPVNVLYRGPYGPSPRSNWTPLRIATCDYKGNGLYGPLPPLDPQMKRKTFS